MRRPPRGFTGYSSRGPDGKVGLVSPDRWFEPQPSHLLKTGPIIAAGSLGLLQKSFIGYSGLFYLYRGFHKLNIFIFEASLLVPYFEAKMSGVLENLGKKISSTLESAQKDLRQSVAKSLSVAATSIATTTPTVGTKSKLFSTILDRSKRIRDNILDRRHPTSKKSCLS
jgi:hypothetical protein